MGRYIKVHSSMNKGSNPGL